MWPFCHRSKNVDEHALGTIFFQRKWGNGSPMSVNLSQTGWRTWLDRHIPNSTPVCKWKWGKYTSLMIQSVWGSSTHLFTLWAPATSPPSHVMSLAQDYVKHWPNKVICVTKKHETISGRVTYKCPSPKYYNTQLLRAIYACLPRTDSQNRVILLTFLGCTKVTGHIWSSFALGDGSSMSCSIITHSTTLWMQNIYFTVYTFLHLEFGQLFLSGCRDMHDSFWACDAWSSRGVRSLSNTTSNMHIRTPSTWQSLISRFCCRNPSMDIETLWACIRHQKWEKTANNIDEYLSFM